MQRDLRTLVNLTVSPFYLAYVPSWTGLGADVGAMRERVAAANRESPQDSPTPTERRRRSLGTPRLAAASA